MPSLSDLASAQVHSKPLQHGSAESSINYEAHENPGSLFARRDFLVEAHRDWKDRVKQITLIANGEWYRVWPDLTRQPTAPTVANIIELSIAHVGAVGGAVIPSVRVPTPFESAGPDGSRGARKRERRIRELRDRSNLGALLAQLWQDYAGAGAAAIGVWANFDEPNPAKRNPYYMRLDPRHYYPVKDASGNITELLVARKRNVYDLTREYPQLSGELTAAGNEVEEWWWYTNDEFMHAVVDLPQEDPNKRNMVILSRAENRLGCIPVVEIQRPTFDGERRGQFDQTVHILRTAHHLMSLTIDRTEEEVYPTIAAWDVDKVETFGPGATMQYRSPEGRIDVFSPKQMFDVKDLIARLEDNARNAARFPQQLTGEPGASIASGRAIAASMGALDAVLAVAHRQFEWGLAKADSLALRVDEVYCDGKKTIYGDAHDRKNPESFIPSRDIAGSYDVVVSYGLGAGSDPQNKEVRLHMHLGAGLLSRTTARDELDFLEDPEQEEILLAREMTMDAMNQGMVAMAVQQGNAMPAVEFLKLLRKPGVSLDEALERLSEVLAEAAQQAQQQAQGGPSLPDGAGGGDPFAPVSAAESLSRGGIPGNAPGLPSLPGILSPGAPRQVM